MSDNITGFEVIADQDGDPISIARKLAAFAADRGLKGEGVRAGTVEHTEEEHRYEALDDQIESINRQLPEGWMISWHPDDSGTVVYARLGDEPVSESTDNPKCSRCGHYNAMMLATYSPVGAHTMRCRDCGHTRR